MKDKDILFGSGVNRRCGRELAKVLGVSPSTITNWKSNPDHIPKGKLEILFRTCNISNKDILALFGRKA